MDRKVINSVKRFTAMVNKEFSVKKVILYGSYAKGTQNEYSDIDIAVVLDKFEGDILKANSRLFALVRAVDVRIEPVILESDFDKSGFIESISKYGKVIFSAN